MAKKSFEYRFLIDAFSPETLPMSRLAEYMAELASMLGEEKSVHFVKLECGSTVLVQRVEWEAVPKVRERIHAVRMREGPPEAQKAFDNLDRKLARDNAKGELRDQLGAKVIQFPGRTRESAEFYGPFNQPGILDGVLIRVGGERDPVPVHLEDGIGEVYMCHASRHIARDMAPQIFGPILRVNGTGRWHRTQEGQWEMDRFNISTFDVLRETTFRHLVNKLRTLPTDLGHSEDPIGILDKIRRGNGETQ